MKKILSLMVTFAILLSGAFIVCAQTGEDTLSDDIVILYTNDVHTYIDGELSYDVLSAIKKDLQKQYKYVILADAGDHIQGTAYGSMDKGENIIAMMNEAGYDVATLGNHEFDYGMDGCLNAVELAEFPYISANFYREENGVRTENVLESYVIFECGDEKVAFVGITTPETFEKSTSAYFKDEEGNFIYGISGGKDGSALQTDVQKAIDSAKADGATVVIALGHLGIDPSSAPWTSTETIANLSGLDAFIDGHSHSTVECETVAGKDGNNVVLTQTGSYFDRIGIMIVDSETDEIKTDFIEYQNIAEDGDGTEDGRRLVSDLYAGTEVLSDSAVKEIKDSWIAEIDEMLGEKIGSSNVVLDNYDADGNRLVRSAETNSGDFAADALYYLFDEMEMDVDVAVMNGGGIRNTAISGDISYKTCKDIHTFGNVACLQTVTGRQILDALEWGAMHVGTGERGGFLQVSGITYKIDTSVPNTVKEDEMGTWIGGPDEYRVFDVMVYDREKDEYAPLDENAEYRLAGYNYTLRNLGDGYAMFDGAVNVLDYVSEDYMVIANYVKSFENGTVDAQNSPLKEKYPNMLLDYSDVNGSGRIEICEKKPDNTDEIFENHFSDVGEDDWFFESVCFAAAKGIMNGMSDTLFAPNDTVTRAMLVTAIWRAEGQPQTDYAMLFSDVDDEKYYTEAVRWAASEKIVSGVTETEFAPDENITREQIAAIIYRYAEYKGISPAGAWAIRIDYSDLDEISDYAAEGIMYCALKGIMNGRDSGAFSPKDFATRAETAAILGRFLQNS